MHDTAMEYGKLFFDTYVKNDPAIRVVDIGAQDVNGSLRTVAPPRCEYVGVDFVEGKGVDIIIDDPYKLPLPSDSFDACVTSSCFEHSEFFWLTYLEIMRVLKPSGVLYVNVPSNGSFHRFPVDCWRFYPDSGSALQNWGQRNGLNNMLLESFTGVQKKDIWNDFVAVLLKDQSNADQYPGRMLNKLTRYTNGYTAGRNGFSQFEERSEDQRTQPSRIRSRLRRLIRPS